MLNCKRINELHELYNIDDLNVNQLKMLLNTGKIDQAEFDFYAKIKTKNSFNIFNIVTQLKNAENILESAKLLHNNGKISDFEFDGIIEALQNNTNEEFKQYVNKVVNNYAL